MSMESDKQILDMCRQLSARGGYVVHLTHDDTGLFPDSVTAGDSNCPCPKYYDPSDGHGFTHVDDDDYEIDDFDSSECPFGVWVMRQLMDAAIEREGQSIDNAKKEVIDE